MHNKNTEDQRYESNRDSQAHRRSGQSRYPQGDTTHNAYPRGRAVADIIDTVGKVLLCNGRSGETERVEVVHSDEMVAINHENPGEGETEGKRRTVVDAGIVRHFTMTLKEVFC